MNYLAGRSRCSRHPYGILVDIYVQRWCVADLRVRFRSFFDRSPRKRSDPVARRSPSSTGSDRLSRRWTTFHFVDHGSPCSAGTMIDRCSPRTSFQRNSRCPICRTRSTAPCTARSSTLPCSSSAPALSSARWFRSRWSCWSSTTRRCPRRRCRSCRRSSVVWTRSFLGEAISRCTDRSSRSTLPAPAPSVGDTLARF